MWTQKAVSGVLLSPVVVMTTTSLEDPDGNLGENMDPPVQELPLDEGEKRNQLLRRRTRNIGTLEDEGTKRT